MEDYRDRGAKMAHGIRLEKKPGCIAASRAKSMYRDVSAWNTGDVFWPCAGPPFSVPLPWHPG